MRILVDQVPERLATDIDTLIAGDIVAFVHFWQAALDLGGADRSRKQ